jgi:hypothetical protein
MGRMTQLRGRIGYRRKQQGEKDLLLNGRASRPTFCSGTQPEKGRARDGLNAVTKMPQAQ